MNNVRAKNRACNRERVPFNTRTLIFFLGGSIMTKHYKKESDFQKDVINEIQERLPGSIVMKTDPRYIQGLPDLLVLFNDRWASLECKRSATANKQPNQDTYVEMMNDMSISRFIYPENKEEVLNEVQSALQSRRKSRSTRSK